MQRPIVVDTNILFSALGWTGTPHQCVQAARRGRCYSITCAAILNELSEKLQLKRRFDASKAAESVTEIRAFSEMVAVPGELRVVAADPDDDAILECAIKGGAHYVVSGDRHLLSLGQYEGIQIKTATDFLALLDTIRR